MRLNSRNLSVSTFPWRMKFERELVFMKVIMQGRETPVSEGTSTSSDPNRP